MADDSLWEYVSRPWHVGSRVRDIAKRTAWLIPPRDWQQLRQPSVLVPVLAVSIMAIAAAILASSSVSLAVAVVICLAYTIIALKSPYAGVVLFLPSIAILPQDAYLRGGLWIPALIRLAAPVLLGAVLFRAFSTRMQSRFRLTALDALVCALGLFGAVNLAVTGATIFAKMYAKSMLFPLFFYFIARFMEWDRGRFRALLGIQLAATALCALLMVLEGVSGQSLLYRQWQEHRILHGVRAGVGPFKAWYHAASFLCLWPSLFFYAAASARRFLGRGFWLAGGLVTIVALARTNQRAMIVGAVLGLCLCLMARDLRKVLMLAGCVGLLVLGPLLILDRGPSWIIDRFTEERAYDTRQAYNAAAVGILKSADWNPVFGIGFSQFPLYAAKYTPPELAERAFGVRAERLLAGGRYAPRQHNIALSLLVEFGMAGTGLFCVVLVGIGWHWLQCVRPSAHGDIALPVALLSTGVAALFAAWFHNLYFIASATVYLWFFAGLVVGHKHLFRMPSDGVDEAAHATGLPRDIAVPAEH